MKHKTIILTLLLSLGGVSQAQEVVHIDLEKVYQQSSVIQQVRNTVNDDFQEQRESLDSQSKQILEMTEKLEKDAITLSDQELEQQRAEIEKLERKFVRERQAFVEDRGGIMQAKRRLMDIEIAKVIEVVAKEKGASMVINPYLTTPISGNRTFTSNIILYANPDADADITDVVIERFDSKINVDQFFNQ